MGEEPAVGFQKLKTADDYMELKNKPGPHGMKATLALLSL